MFLSKRPQEVHEYNCRFPLPGFSEKSQQLVTLSSSPSIRRHQCDFLVLFLFAT